ncbi:MAG: insulinase family protein [Verrucomicrobiae bacterium]|nr:insulinase family protein [Verrucomicrobiae bacterium]
MPCFPADSPAARSSRFRLPNDLLVILCEDRRAPVISAQVWFRTGSMHEGDRLGSGISHFLEHMLFKGTATRGVGDLAREVEAAGGSVNAYTGWDRTVYYVDGPSDGGCSASGAGVEKALDVLLDAARHSTLPEEEFAKEREVILREMAMYRDSPDSQASELLFATAYAVHPSRHPVIGHEDLFRALTREDLIAWYRARYAPNHALLIVAGDFDPARVRTRVEELAGGWARRPLASEHLPDEPAQIAPREVEEESRTAAEQTRLHVAWQAFDFRHADAPALEALAMIAGHGRSSRLYQTLREKKALVHSVDAWTHLPAWTGLLGASALVEHAKVNAAREAILMEMERFAHRPVTRAELSRALKQAMSGHLGARKTMHGIAAELARGELVAGDLAFFDQYLERLREVAPSDLQRVAGDVLRGNRLTRTAVHPKGSLRRAGAAPVSRVETQTRREDLSNGLTLLMREDRRLPFVNLRLVMKSGLLFEDGHINGVSNLVARLLLKGTKRRSAERIAREIESVGGTISTYSGSNSLGLCLEVLKPDLPLALEVLADLVENPAFAPTSIEREREAQLADLRREREQPMRVALQNARTRLFGAHPYGLPPMGTEKSIAALSREDLLAFWRRLAVPSNMALAVFGDLQPAEVRRLVRARFGALPRGVPPSAITAKPPFGRANRVEEACDKEQAVVVAAFPGLDLSSPDRPTLELLTAALSGMGSRLFVRLRDELALCYYVGVADMLGLERGFLWFYIGTDPAKAADAEREMLAEVARLRREGVEGEEITRARAGLLGEHHLSRQDPGGYALSSALDELYGLGHDYADRLDAALKNIAPDQVRALADRLFSVPPVVSVVRPLAQAAPPPASNGAR